MKYSQADGFSQWLKIRSLYKNAFPREERKPLFIIKSMQKNNKSDVWYFEKDGKFVGFAATINGDDIILLDYLAVDEKHRHKGIGSTILKTLRHQYMGKGVFVEIERVKIETDDQDIRMKRKQFYLSNGMSELKVYAQVFGVEMELMGWDCTLDFAGYHSFYRENYSELAAKNIIQLPAE